MTDLHTQLSDSRVQHLSHHRLLLLKHQGITILDVLDTTTIAGTNTGLVETILVETRTNISDSRTTTMSGNNLQ